MWSCRDLPPGGVLLVDHCTYLPSVDEPAIIVTALVQGALNKVQCLMKKMKFFVFCSCDFNMWKGV